MNYEHRHFQVMGNRKFATIDPLISNYLWVFISNLKQEVRGDGGGSEKGAEVAYYLGKHLDVADRLTQMNPVEAGRELYRIESMFQGQPKQESRTPAPPPSVGGGSGATTFDPSDTKIPIEQWIKQMEARDRAKLG